MELQAPKHLTTKIKSGLILTLIFSYLGDIEQIQSLLALISKQGRMFLEKNLEQLNHFCSPPQREFVLIEGLIPSKRLNGVILSSLEVDLRQLISLPHLQHLGETIEMVENLILNSIYGLQKDELSFLLPLIQKAKHLETRIGTLVVLIEEIEKRKISLNRLESVSVTIGQMHYSHFSTNQQFPWRLISELKISPGLFDTDQHNYYQRLISKIDPEKLEKFTLIFQPAFKRRDSPIVDLLKMIPDQFKNIKKLDITMEGNNFAANLHIFGDLANIESFSLRSGFFDFSIVTYWPNLTSLSVILEETVISETHLKHIQNLTSFQIIPCSSGKQPIKLTNQHQMLIKCLEQSAKLVQFWCNSKFLDINWFLKANNSVKKLFYQKRNNENYYISTLNQDDKKNFTIKELETNQMKSSQLDLNLVLQLQSLKLYSLELKSLEVLQEQLGFILTNKQSKIKKIAMSRVIFKDTAIFSRFCQLCGNAPKLRSIEIQYGNFKEMDLPWNYLISLLSQSKSLTEWIVFVQIPDLETFSRFTEATKVQGRLENVILLLQKDPEFSDETFLDSVFAHIARCGKSFKILKIDIETKAKYFNLQAARDRFSTLETFLPLLEEVTIDWSVGA